MKSKRSRSQRHTVQIAMSDGSGGPETYRAIAGPCLWCGRAGALWEEKSGRYRVCLSCTHGWDHESVMRDHSSTAANNDVIAQVVEQLAHRRRHGSVRRAA